MYGHSNLEHIFGWIWYEHINPIQSMYLFYTTYIMQMCLYSKFSKIWNDSRKRVYVEVDGFAYLLQVTEF